MSGARRVPVAAETLVGVEVLRSLNAEGRRAVAEQCIAHRYESGEQILSYRDDDRDVYFIISGKVRVTLFSSSGKEITFRDEGPGDMFGELSALDGQPRSANVVALSEATVATMPVEVFWKTLLGQPEVAQATLIRLATLVRLLSERVFEFSTLAVSNRIHAELLRLARLASQNPDGNPVISPVPTHADMASRVSTHREAVTRELNRLAELKILERQRSALVITDLARLERLVREASGE